MGAILNSVPNGTELVLESEKHKFYLHAILVRKGISGRCGLFRITHLFQHMPKGGPLATGNYFYKINEEYWFGEEEIAPLERYQVWG